MLLIKEKVRNIIKGNKGLYNTFLLLNKDIYNYPQKNITGKNNILKYKNTTVLKNSKVEIIGNNNKISIGDSCRFNNVTFYILGDYNTILISDNVIFKSGSLWIEDTNCLIEINESCTFEEAHLAATESNSKILIGNDCMFANDIDIRTGDSHSIFDLETGNRSNYAKNVLIESHVWIAAHCSVLKGVTIKKNSIIATRSVVNKAFEEENVIIGGNPAKIIKRNIIWTRERTYKAHKPILDKNL